MEKKRKEKEGITLGYDLRDAPERTSLSADPGPDQHAGSDPARDGGADDRSSRAEFAELGREVLDGLKPMFQTRRRS